MIPMESKLTGIETDYKTFKNSLEWQNFSLGGNWEYDKGCFDRRLDGEKQTVWLRIPFEVPNGSFDPANSDERTRLTIGTPFVLKHQYNTGDDHDASINTFGALVDQFQTPTNSDAPIDQQYVERARSVLLEVERAFFREF